MKKIALFLAVVFMLPCMTSCKKSKKDSYTGKTISEDRTWWNETEVTVTPDEIKSAAKGAFHNVSPSCLYSDENSVILYFSLAPDDETQPYVDILRQYSLDGKLLGQIILNDYFGDKDYLFNEEVFASGNNKYSAAIKDEDGTQLAYDLDFENSTLKDPGELHYPEMDDGYFSSVNTMEGVGDKIVYLVNYSVDGRPAYRVYVDDGFNLRTFDLDFGRDAQVGSISSFRAAGHHVFFTAEVAENGIDKEYSCELNITNFDLKKTPIQNPDDLINLYFISDSKALSCDTHKVYTLDVSTGTKEEFLNFSDTYVFGDYLGARILHATDNEIVLFREDQNGFGMNSTVRLIKFTKTDKNPTAGRKALVLAYFDWLGDAEYNAINAFNKSSTEYFIEATDKYFDIANASPDENSGVSILAQNLSGQVNAMDLLISDIKSGTGPDLVIYDSQFEKLNHPDYLIDLTKRIESQESLKSGDYMDFVLSPNGRDGKHYRLNYSYVFDGFFVNKNFLDDGMKGMTFAQYDKIIEEDNLGKSVLYQDDLSLLKALVRTSDCFSYDASGKLSLNTANFRAIAEYIASIPDNISYDDGMLELTNVLRLDYMQAQGFTSAHGKVYENHSIIGYPSPDGHAETINGTGIGITSTCSAQDGAWEFALTLLTPESQRTLCDPVMKSIQKENLLRYVQEFNATRMTMHEPERLTDEFADWYISEVSDAIVVPDINPTVMMIMCEEMPAYFAGDKTLDEVIGVIENRINLLINEQG